MKSRRTFLKNSAVSILALQIPLAGCTGRTPAKAFEAPKTISSALVIWNSQTGNTRRAGERIADLLTAQGLEVSASEYRQVDPKTLSAYDLIVSGTPVHYFDIPENYKNWLLALPDLNGKPVASYVTFGGIGHNQHNTACRVLEILEEKGGIPVGLAAFGHMSSYAVTWSTGNEERILKYTHMPDSSVCRDIDRFAEEITGQVKSGRGIEIDRKFFVGDWFRGAPSRWGAKVFAKDHQINKSTCIDCGRCTDVCPTGAVDQDAGTVDSDACIFCLGCINNCPADAVEMTYLGKPVYGLKAFRKMHGLKIVSCR